MLGFLPCSAVPHCLPGTDFKVDQKWVGAVLWCQNGDASVLPPPNCRPPAPIIPKPPKRKFGSAKKKLQGFVKIIEVGISVQALPDEMFSRANQLLLPIAIPVPVIGYNYCWSLC